MELEQLAAKVSEIVQEAGNLIKSIPRPQVYTKEGHANFVTEADMASQKFLIEHLTPLLPDAYFFAEEKEDNQLAPGWNWIIDPIDGTTNFIRDYKASTISVGLVKDGEGVLGLVLDSLPGRAVHRDPGTGSFLQWDSYPRGGRAHCQRSHRFRDSALLPGAERSHFRHGQGSSCTLR